ncbi:MAG: hypothetical protein IPI35_08210 [Deltaproteobacteria bacterium]|nr:hypothetical protein [Deltaproteobacteria bacterium]
MSPRLPLLLALAACGDRLAEAPAPDAVRLTAELSDRAVTEGEPPPTLSVSLELPEGWTGTLGLPAVEGLTFTPADAEGRFTLEGEPGSYIIPPVTAEAKGPAGEVETKSVGPFYLDLGVVGPSSALEDLALAPPPPPSPWPWVLGALVVTGLVAALVVWGNRKKAEARVVPPPPPLSPEEEALLAWAALRARADLDDHALALGLSSIFRRYLERVSGFPATALTTYEVLDRLSLDHRVNAAEHDRAQRLLDATDLIKFARSGGGAALFDALDADLRAVIAAMRPAPAPKPEPGDV